jgi:hypothetical protein
MSKVSGILPDNNYNFSKVNLIDGDYTDDGCCVDWENVKVSWLKRNFFRLTLFYETYNILFYIF